MTAHKWIEDETSHDYRATCKHCGCKTYLKRTTVSSGQYGPWFAHTTEKQVYVLDGVTYEKRPECKR